MGYMKVDNLYKNNQIMEFKHCYALEKVHGCLHESMKVRMSDGSEKTMKDIQTGDQVVTYDERNKNFTTSTVAGKIVQPKTDKLKWYNLSFDNGKNLLCTEDHPIYTNTRGWVEAKDLTFEDDILGDEEWMQNNAKQNIENMQENGEKN